MNPAKESPEDAYDRGPQVGRGAFGKVYKGYPGIIVSVDSRPLAMTNE